jgi:hypothetical protein
MLGTIWFLHKVGLFGLIRWGFWVKESIFFCWWKIGKRWVFGWCTTLLKLLVWFWANNIIFFPFTPLFLVFFIFFCLPLFLHWNWRGSAMWWAHICAHGFSTFHALRLINSSGKPTGFGFFKRISCRGKPPDWF